MATNKLRVFLSYSHKDEKELNRLNVHLADLRQSNLIETWYDRQISAGSQWKPEILRELDQADVILFLVSPDFIASDFCRLVETVRALQREREGAALVIPIALKPVATFPKELAHIQGVPRNLKPITKHSPKDDGFVAAVRLISEAMKAFAPKRKPDEPSDSTDPDFEERLKRKIEAAVEEFCAILASVVSSEIRNQILATLRLPNGNTDEIRTATFLLFDGEKPTSGFYSNAMFDLSGLAQNPSTKDPDAQAIEKVQMLLTRRLFPRPLLSQLVAKFKDKKSAVIGAVANHIGAEVAVKSAHGLEPTFVPSNEDGSKGVAGHGLLKFVAAPLGKPSPEEDVAQILKELASQIELDLDQPVELEDTPEARIRYWAGRINRKVDGKAREWYKSTRPLNDASELSGAVFYCVIRQPSGAKREKLHALLQMVRKHAPALLFFELNPLADFRDDEDTALEFVSRLFNRGKEQSS
ncbi:MAG: toll/interleukin-1 receptor domain-containing protein [Planctomycetaceae bacterium]|nr:toll/interleukin-1 receptor domain-containing protein [Planctomycetaceae bacterium]